MRRRRRTPRCPRTRARPCGRGRPAARAATSLELRPMLEQAAERRGLLPDLREKLDARARGTASGCDMCLSSDEHALDLEFFAEDDDIRRSADRDPARVSADRPAPGRLSPRRGHPRAALPSACRFRTASIIVSTLPASTPSSRRTTPSRTSTAMSPSRYEPSPLTPAPATASVTSARRPPAARQTTRTVSGARWTKSRMIWTTTSSRASAAPATPGSRWVNGRIALKRCVTVPTPRSNAAFASSPFASVCPAETVTPRATSRSTSSSAPGSSGASVYRRTGPAASSRSSRSGSGSRRA